MRAAIRRMQTGGRWWAAEIGFRLLALVLFVLAAASFRRLETSVVRPPVHEPTVAEFALCASAVAMGFAGLACLIEGPGLFRLVPYPRRRLL